MGDTQELKQILRECLETEEMVIPLYSRHISNTLFLSGLDKETQEKVRAILDKLREDSSRHKQILERELRRLEGTVSDVH